MTNSLKPISTTLETMLETMQQTTTRQPTRYSSNLSAGASKPAEKDDYPRNETGICPDCRGAGWFVADVPVGHPKFGTLIPCHCTERRREQARQNRAAAALADLHRQLGARLARATFESFSLDRRLSPVSEGGRVVSIGEQRQVISQALATARAWAVEPFGWLYLYGPPGGGKTHLAAAAVTAVAAQGHDCAYASVPDLVSFVQAGFGDNSASDRIAALKTVHLLLLDDLGTENRSEYNQRLLFELLNARYNDDRATIITSNLTIEQQGARLSSRIHEMATVLPLFVSDYRREAAA